MTVRHLSRRALNAARWDDCVDRCPTRLPYGKCWWLDAATNGRWSGLVLDDYRAVLPLPHADALGRFSRVLRPPFTQQLGPFGAEVGPAEVTTLLNNLPATLPAFRLPLAETVPATTIPSRFNVRTRTNLILDISADYDDLHTGFHRILRRKLRKYGRATLSPASPETIIDLYRANVGDRVGLKAVHYRCIRRLMDAATANQAALCCRVDSAEGELLAAGFFPFHRGRIINSFAASSPLGYQREGMVRLLTEIIRAHGGPGRILDFEGSDIPGVAEFFRAFGPEERPYPEVSFADFRRHLARI